MADYFKIIMLIKYVEQRLYCGVMYNLLIYDV